MVAMRIAIILFLSSVTLRRNSFCDAFTVRHFIQGGRNKVTNGPRTTARISLTKKWFIIKPVSCSSRNDNICEVFRMKVGDRGSEEIEQPKLGRRRSLSRISSSIGLGILIQSAFSHQTAIHPALAYTPDSNPLRESLYLMSRVQEATVQQERFANNPKITTQEELKKKLTLSLRLVERSYRLVDQINYASQFIPPDADIVTATTAGYEAADALQSAIDFVKRDLQTGPLLPSQRATLSESLKDTRNELFTFLSYMPQDALEQARSRVERENVDNRDEFDGPEDAGVYNPVKLPWK